MLLKDLRSKFIDIFKHQHTPSFYFSPGRINLIGEHTDYNGGHVFPAAISFGTYALASKRQDQLLRFYSVNFPDAGIIECTIDELDFNEEHDWANYPKGMLQAMMQNEAPITQGFDVLFYGNIPNGAGLSSSASVELVTGVLINDLFNLENERLDLIKLGQKVENEYIGVNSGIMDQFAVGNGQENHAMLLNCQTLQFEYAPLNLKNHAILVINTNKRRTLSTSNYNERNAECQTALKDLQTALTIQYLCDVTLEQFEEHQHLIQNPIHRKRAKHVIYENARTKEAYIALQKNDLQQFGQFMNESHHSLRDDFEVTGEELDTIVHAAWEHPGVIGARMTGAGFGGCAIAIVENEQVESFQKTISEVYTEKIGYEPSFYLPTIADGAKKLTEEAII